MKSSHKLAAGLALLVILIVGAYFTLTALQAADDKHHTTTTTTTTAAATATTGARPTTDAPIEPDERANQSAATNEQRTTSESSSSTTTPLPDRSRVLDETRTSPREFGVPVAKEVIQATSDSVSSDKQQQSSGATTADGRSNPAALAESPSTLLTTPTTTTTPSATTATTTPAPPTTSEGDARSRLDEGESALEPMSTEKLYRQATTLGPGEPLDQLELERWDEFKRSFRPAGYASADEEKRRREVFAGNLRFINAFNRNSRALFRLGVNKFADLSQTEINQMFIGPPTNWSQTLSQSQGTSPPPMRILADQEVQTSEQLRQVDWRNLASGEPLDQGQCRDSSIFAVVAALESALNAANPTAAKVKLSEQQVIDCLTYGAPPPPNWPPACSGNLSMVHVFDFLQRQAIRFATVQEYAEFKLAQARGLVAPNSCIPPPQRTGAPEPRPRLGAYVQVHRDNIDEALLNGGPLVVAMDASLPTFHFYASGLYHELGCSSEVYNLHALLVGLAPASSDGDPNLAHYTLRASLGSNWGELGHMRLLKDAVRNKCLPHHLATYPNLAFE